MIRVIDMKRLDLTATEWKMYDEICEHLSTPRLKGEVLFKGLFETDKNGIITFLRAPQSMFNLEAFMFLQSMMVHQHLRISTSQHDQLAQQYLEKIKELDKKTQELDKIIQESKNVGSTVPS